MTYRRFLLPNVGRVTVSTFAGLLVLVELFFNRHGLWISRLLVVFVAISARGDWHVGREPTQGCGARDVDVAGRAFHHVLAFAAFVRELGRTPFGRERRDESRRRFMTAGTIILRWLFRFPMTSKASLMRPRHRLERMKHRRVGCGQRQSNDRERHVGLMTDRAVVVIGFLIINRR